MARSLPVTISVYLGAGDEGLDRLERLDKRRIKEGKSLSEFIVELIDKALA